MDKSCEMGDNSVRMEVGGDENEAGYLQDRVDSLDQSMDSLQNSFDVPVFNTRQTGSLQNSQGFTFSGVTAITPTNTLLQTFNSAQPLSVTGETSQIIGVSPQSTFVSPAFTVNAKPPQSSCQASCGHYSQIQSLSNTTNINQSTSGVDSVTQDIKPLFLSGDFASSGHVGLGQPNPGGVTNPSHDQTVLNSGAFVMSLQNNPGIVHFGQADNHPGELKSDNSVFTFIKEYDSAKLTPASTENTAELSSAGQSWSKATRAKQSSKHRQRKNRSQSTSNENVTKTETQQGGSPSKLDTTDSQNNGEIGFKPLLLDEILTEKKMALLRSPDVIQFLQAQQKKITHGQYTET